MAFLSFSLSACIFREEHSENMKIGRMKSIAKQFFASFIFLIPYTLYYLALIPPRICHFPLSFNQV